VYLAEGYWPGVTRRQLAHLLGRARTAAEELSREGQPVRVTGTWLVPNDETVFVFIEAETIDRAHAVNERVGVTFERIVEAVSVEAVPVEAEQR